MTKADIAEFANGPNAIWRFQRRLETRHRRATARVRPSAPQLAPTKRVLCQNPARSSGPHSRQGTRHERPADARHTVFQNSRAQRSPPRSGPEYPIGAEVTLWPWRSTHNVRYGFAKETSITGFPWAAMNDPGPATSDS